jgi:hypothetical protein
MPKIGGGVTDNIMIKYSNTQFVFFEKNSNHLEYKKKLLDEIFFDIERLKKISKQFNDYYTINKTYTSYYNTSDSLVNYRDLCHNLIYPNLDKLINNCNLNCPRQSYVNKIWYNSYESCGRHEIHNHPDSDISGIYILELSGEKNNTVFYPNNHNSSFFIETIYTEDIDEGSLILFPSHLLHQVTQCKKPKISISFNISSIF